MGAVVISGGTDGIGRGLADEYLRRGDEVLVVGRDGSKVTGSGAEFFAADLSSIDENERLIAYVRGRFSAVDVLVLGARFHRPVRTVTADGFESNFALFYLSRYLLGHGLAEPLSRAKNPVVLNFGGAGQTGPVRWDDLQGERGYHGVGAMGHAGALNDLLGVDFVRRRPGIRYVLNHPGVVVTSFAGEYDSAGAAAIAHLRTVGKTVDTSVAQILPYLDAADGDPLTAVLEGRRVPLGPSAAADAERLRRLTEKLLLSR